MDLRSVYQQIFIQILFFARFEPGYTFDSNPNGFIFFELHLLPAKCRETKETTVVRLGVSCSELPNCIQAWVRGHSRGI